MMQEKQTIPRVGPTLRNLVLFALAGTPPLRFYSLQERNLP